VDEVRRRLEQQPDREFVRGLLPATIEVLAATEPSLLVQALASAGIGDGARDPVELLAQARSAAVGPGADGFVDAMAATLSRHRWDPSHGTAGGSWDLEKVRHDAERSLAWLDGSTREQLVELAVRHPGLHGRLRVISFLGPVGAGKAAAASWLNRVWLRRGAIDGYLPVVTSASLLLGYHNTFHSVTQVRNRMLVVTGIDGFVDGGMYAAPEDLDGLVRELRQASSPVVVLMARDPAKLAAFARLHRDLPALLPPPVVFAEPDPGRLAETVTGYRDQPRLMPGSRVSATGSGVVEALTDALVDLASRPGWERLHSARRLFDQAQELSRPGPLRPEHVLRAAQLIAPRPLSRPLPELLAELDSMVGLAEVKETVAAMLALHEDNRRRCQQGLAPVGALPHPCVSGLFETSSLFI
jgi:hypothetical protein